MKDRGHFSPFMGMSDEMLLTELKRVHEKLERLQPLATQAIHRVRAAKVAVEQTPEWVELQAAQQERKALGSYRGLDSEAHLLRLEVRRRGLPCPPKPEYVFPNEEA
jgi:hypothetical protein